MKGLNSIRRRFFIYMALSISIIIALVMTFSIFTLYKNQKKNLDIEMNTTIEDKTKYFGEWLNTKIILVQTAYKFYIEGKSNYNLNNSFLLESGISDAYTGFEDGSHYDFTGWIPPVGYDPRVRPWYKDVKKKNAITISSPYVDLVTKKYAVSIGIPLTKHGVFHGVLAIDIMMDTILKETTRLNFNGIGNCWIVNEQGVIIADRDKKLINQNIGSIPELSGFTKVIKKKDNGYLNYSLKGVSERAIYKSIPHSNWTLIVTVEKNRAYKGLDIFIVILAIALILSIVFSSIAAEVISINLYTPIDKIINFARSIAEGNLDKQMDIKVYDEFDVLVDALNNMTCKLKDNFDVIGKQKSDLMFYSQNLEQMVETRTSELKIANQNLTKAQEELLYFATTDYLTGMNNRRRFYSIAENEHNRSERNGNSYSILMMDIDDFKNINDTYGHPVGDLVLKTLASSLGIYTREYDVAARFGGEEFILLFPETSLQTGVQIAERIRKAVSELKIEGITNKFNFTLSIGVSAYLPGDDSVDDVIERADKCLYEAKKEGKNQVVAG